MLRFLTRIAIIYEDKAMIIHQCSLLLMYGSVNDSKGKY